MFQSFTYESKPIESINYTIVDDDFTETISCGWNEGVVVAIIAIYERRGLNVAANLFRAFRYYVEKFGGSSWDINDMIRYTKDKNSNYMKYANDVEKYLVLA